MEMSDQNVEYYEPIYAYRTKRSLLISGMISILFSIGYIAYWDIIGVGGVDYIQSVVSFGNFTLRRGDLPPQGIGVGTNVGMIAWHNVSIFGFTLFSLPRDLGAGSLMFYHNLFFTMIIIQFFMVFLILRKLSAKEITPQSIIT